MHHSDATDDPAPSPPAARTDADSMLDEAGQALFRLGRLFGRRPAHAVVAERTGRAVELSRILVVQAVEQGPAAPDDEITVGLVAERLDLDPSTASRLVAETIGDGYLARAASPADARRVQLTLTDAGRALGAGARRYQRAVFDHVTRDWSARDRRTFARLFTRFAATLEDDSRKDAKAQRGNDEG